MKRIVFLSALLGLGCLVSVAQVPTITSFSPTSGPVGTTVTITGTNFNSTADIVMFGATKGIVTAASSTQLTVTVPVGASYEPITVSTGGLIAYARQPFVLTFPGGNPLGSSSFSTGVHFTPGSGPLYIASRDLDGDGKAEVIGTINGSDIISVFHNTSTPGSIDGATLASSVDFVTGSMPRGFDMDDLDGDGRPDVVVANSNSSTISVFRNTSSPGSITAGSLAAKVDFVTSSLPYDVEIGDLDKDGKPDVVTVNAGAGTLSLYRNTSTPGVINAGTFASRIDIPTATNPFDVDLCDLDGDGLTDIVIANQGSSSVSVFRNISTPGTINAGSFSSRVDFTTAAGPYKVSIGDLDGDQKPDLALPCYSGQAISVLRNTSTSGTITAGSFATKIDLTTPAGNYDMVMTDLDGDGKPDLASGTDNANHISIFKNNATSGALSIGSFAARIDISSGAYTNFLAAGDIDNDGKPELIGGGERVTVLRNMVLATEPTSQPTNLIFFHITSTAFDGSWTEPVPQPDGYLAVMSGTVAPNFIPVDGITYNIDAVGVGTVSGHTMYIVQNSSEPGIDLSGLASENIFIKVYAFNGTGPTINYLTTAPLSGSQVPTADLVKPVAANATLATVASNANLVFKADFTDAGSGVDYAEVEYRPITAVASVNFQTLEMFPTTGSTFEIDLPANEVGELGVEFRFNVVDFEGNDNSLAQATYTTRVRHDDGLVIPYPQPGRTVAAYRIIAVPLILDDKSVNAVMGNHFGAYDPTVYAAYHWTGTRLEELNDETQLEIGRGYWFITGIDITPGLSTGPGVTPDVSPSNPYQITLTPGWNQIGNPYNFHISWGDILAANPTKLSALGGSLSKIRVFDGSVGNVDELHTFEGGFVKNVSDPPANITIDIPVAKNPSINSRKATAGPLRNTIDQSNWEINFNLSQGATTYNLGGLGMRPDAELAYDNYDDYNLPRFFEYLEVKFPKERVGMTYTKDVVPTANQFVWEFTVESNISEGPIRMGWDNSYYGDAKEIYLVDLVEHRAINMRETDSYAFVAGPSRLFKVVFGDSEFVKNEILPGQPVLFSPYPNPFVDRVTIGYTLPKEAVTHGAAVDIYSGQGVRVSTVDLPAQAGEGSWEWVGQPQTPGMYFVRLRVGNQTVVKKIIKQ